MSTRPDCWGSLQCKDCRIYPRVLGGNDARRVGLSWVDDFGKVTGPQRNKPVFQSQYGADWWVYVNHVQFLPKEEMENGIYFDIGSNDPVFINNTYFFDSSGQSCNIIENS